MQVKLSNTKCQFGKNMFKNKSSNNTNNICGKKIYELRINYTPKLSQRKLAELVQLQGVDLDKNAIQRIESGQRFVTDIEIVAFSKVFNVDFDSLLSD